MYVHKVKLGGCGFKQELFSQPSTLCFTLSMYFGSNSQREGTAILMTMNYTSCPRVSFDFSGRFLPPVYILVFIVGLVANGWGLKSLLHNWKKLRSSITWIFGDVFCKITRFCFNLNLYGSIGFLTCISVYRYLAIVHPVRVMGRITVLHSVGISVLVWLLVSIQIVPDMFFSKTFGNNTGKCYDTTNKMYVEDYLKYSLGWTLTGFCIPFLIALGCYGHVIVVLCRTNNTDKVLKQRSLRLLFILILLYSVCYVPYHVLKNLNLWSRVLLNQKLCREWSNGVYIAHRISRGLVCLNSALNPLVYLHGDENIPAQLRQLLLRARGTISRLSNSNSVLEAQTADEEIISLH
ncbi:hypothetical protein F7725_001134 [Dissostichus mawsoni]|uniref:G-protein coupled receptors family 1 profile domain-containing protein n=1 Tax=Dissostichus mawsoni TaxID=36200 RepID=A0A7J5ZIU1_DISMA|nr:hypothetical protein F7725_001134 [Dissostichus mawsoni]